MRERQVSVAEESLTSREAELQRRIDKGVVEAQRCLLLDYRAKLRLNALRKRLDQEVKRWLAMIDTEATVEGKLYEQVKGVASLDGEASREAIHARSLQLEHSRMFRSLEGRAYRALSDICGVGVSGPLVPDDGGYLGFFLHVVERLEADAEKSHALVEEKSRDLLGQGASDILIHLLLLDPDFDFTVVLDPVPETIRAALAEWVEVHVVDLVARLTPEGGGASS
ncbi:hypothetical protein D1007_24980 [Hordeum vulgare]|nr:hypothetical protein D1007_24980 [Hordeum vulgare]